MLNVGSGDCIIGQSLTLESDEEEKYYVIEIRIWNEHFEKS